MSEKFVKIIFMCTYINHGKPKIIWALQSYEPLFENNKCIGCFN